MNEETRTAVLGIANAAMDHASALTALSAGCLEPRTVNGHSYAIVPPGYKREDITDLVEKAQPTPYRKRGAVAVKDVTSLLLYCADQSLSNSAAAHGYIYADPDKRTITAVFNDHRNANAGWRDHRAEYKAEYTTEVETWLRHNKQPKSQAEFAEFIEDNIADIAEPSGTVLLDVATSLQGKTDINFSSAKRLQNGQVQLQYTETINATAGANGALEIPKEFNLGLRIFKNGSGYKLRARLKYRLNAGTVKFWYELDRPERAVEDAFTGYVNQVREQSGYQVLVGGGVTRVYITGPMTGLPEFNFPAFNAEASRLRALGHSVINPAEINPDTTLSWPECMRLDIALLVTCDTIRLLPGWQGSKGATLEHHIAERLGMEVWGAAS